MNCKFLQLFSGIVGAVTVLFSAWLSHGGKSLPPEQLHNAYLAVIFAFIHVIAIFIVVILFHQLQRRILLISGALFAFGIVTFSGFIILKTFVSIGVLSKLTPLGGMAFVFAWLLLGTTIKGKKEI